MKPSFKLFSAVAFALAITFPTVTLAGGNYDTVNKSIRVDENSIAGNVDSVNGSVRIGANASVKSIDTVNGSIELANNVVVEKDVEAVNGSVKLQSGCEVGGNVETVNGGIRLLDTRVASNVETVNGHIRILDGSEVTGNVVVSKPGGWNWGKKRKPVKVEIGENVRVHGDLIFEQAVELDLHDSASVGEIIGDDVKMVGSS
jgi:predicted acyltransferase (DUF342 family)